MYAHKDELIARSNLPKSWEGPDGTTYPRKWIEDLTIPEQEAMGWYVVVDNPKPVAENETISADDLVFDGSVISQDYTVTEVMPLAEWTAQQQVKADTRLLMEALKDVVLIQVELVDKLLADGVIQAADFSTNVRQSYLDIKPIADRLK